MKFSIVIPVFNESEIIQENIIKLIKFLGDKDYEIIIANNGSTDDTLDKALLLNNKYKQVKVVSSKVRGPGIAFKKAVKMARGNIIISQDMDLPTDLNFINIAYTLMDHYDIVLGVKKSGNQNRSFFRKIRSLGSIILTNVLLDLNFKDYSMAAKAFKRNIILNYLDKLNDDSTYVIQIIYFANEENKKIAEVPVNCIDLRKSKFNMYNRMFRRFNNLIILFLKYRIFK